MHPSKMRGDSLSWCAKFVEVYHKTLSPFSNLSQRLTHSYLQFYMQPISTQVVLVQ
jgi:hypothetical protein